MVQLRLLALCSNIAFIAYAAALHLAPILVLHGILIPVNCCRPVCAWRQQRAMKLNSSAAGY
jgi:hypothetical protein